MSVNNRPQWRRLLFFSTLVGIVGLAPDTHAASFVLAKPDEQPVAEGYFGVSTGVANANLNGDVAFDVAPVPAPIPPAPIDLPEEPMEILPAAMEEPNPGADTGGDGGDQPDEECDEVDDEDISEGDAASADGIWSDGNEKPEMPFGPPEYFVDADAVNSSTSATDPYITSTTTVPSSTQYNPILFWTITTSTQPQASPVLAIPFQAADSDVSPGPADASDVAVGEAQQTTPPEGIVAMASSNEGSVLGVSLVGGALAILLIMIILVLFWAYGCPCRRSRHGTDDDMDCDDDMNEKYTIPAQMRGALQEDNGLWLEEWRKRKEELLNMREPPEVHVSNAVPMSPPLDLEYGREPEKFYNCPL